MPQPTGNELMSGPISSGVVTRKQKELTYVLTNVTKRLEAVALEDNLHRTRRKYFLVCLIFGVGGMMLLFLGTRTTILFSYYSGNYDPVALAFGGLFCLPMVIFILTIICPNREQRSKLKIIKVERKERNKESLFNDLVEKAKKHAEPPPRKIKVFAVFRKKEYPIVGSTMKDFCEALEHQTGLSIERQLIRYLDQDLEIHLTHRLDEHYKLDNGARLFIYNKGGFLTADSALKQEYEELTGAFNAEINAQTTPKDPMGRYNSPNKQRQSSFNEKRQSSFRSDDGRPATGKTSMQDKSRSKVSWKV